MADGHDEVMVMDCEVVRWMMVDPGHQTNSTEHCEEARSLSTPSNMSARTTKVASTARVVPADQWSVRDEDRPN